MKGLSALKKTLIGLAVILTAVGVVGASGTILATLTVTQTAVRVGVPVDI